MNASSREKGDFRAKEERDRDQDRPSLVPSSSRRWSALINPRIVRVSRTFGGKDRHSKVCTVRGLRDRRIRLSAPTAVQLYDLQDKLGVSQPSKVIDWLIDATKHEIDKLPPLQMPPGFSGFPLISPELTDGSSKSAININGNTEIEDAKARSQHGDAIDLMRTKGKEVESRESHLEKAKLVGPNVPAGVNFFPLPNLSSHNLSLAHQLRSQYGLMLQSVQGPFTNDKSDNIASSLSLASNAHHSPSYFSPTTPIMPHSFPPYNNATPHPLAVENNLQLFGSDHSFMPSLHLSGSSTLRPTVGEYVQFLHPENKTGQPPSM